jgi:hypothetical protein
MNFIYLRSSKLHVFQLEPWFLHWQQGGERKVEKSCIASLEHIPSVKGEFVHFFCIFGFWGWASAKFNQSDQFESVLTSLVELVWPVWETSLTGFCLVLAQVQGECAYVQGELLCVLSFCFGGLCSLFALVFASVVWSHCSCLSGPRLSTFKWSCSLPLVGFRSPV